MEVIYLVEEAMNQKVIKKYLPQRQIDVRKSILDISLARSELNWGPKVRLEEGIMRLVGGE